LVSLIQDFTKTQHRVLYYGPKKTEELITLLNKEHVLPDQLKPSPPAVEFAMTDVKKPSVYWVDYDMVQEEIMFLSKGEKFDKGRVPITQMFDEYFGGNMSSPIFQELREAQGLAYSAFAYYGSADKAGDNDLFYAYIGTQADKQTEAMKAMRNLLTEFPKTQSGFDVARDAIVSRIESERITKWEILFNYEEARKRGINYDLRKDVYDQVHKFTLDDVTKFQQQYIKGKNFNVVLIGDKDKIKLKDLQSYGEVKQLSLDEVFGYEKVQKINVEKPNQ